MGVGAARVLLTGASGQVGGELARLLSSSYEVVSPSRAELDLSNEAAVRRIVREVQPEWIVNPAAYTAVDKAESEPELAYAINRDAVRALGEEARAIGAPVIHFSTDYVFDGEGTSAYREGDAARPTSVYGASKLSGERALAESGAAHLILRTSWVYDATGGAAGKNFLLTILKLARQRETLRVVADQHGAPTWSRDLARLTVHVMRTFEGGSPAARLADVSGVYHAGGAGETTWHGFAAEGVRLLAEREPDAKLATIEPITTAEYPTPAKRPVNSRLDCSKLAQTFGWSMMPWQESLRQVVAELG
jgi:dTDP-4-dehydrorhamnose reductase